MNRKKDGCDATSVFSQAPAQLLRGPPFVNCKIISIKVEKISKPIKKSVL